MPGITGVSDISVHESVRTLDDAGADVDDADRELVRLGRPQKNCLKHLSVWSRRHVRTLDWEMATGLRV